MKEEKIKVNPNIEKEKMVKIKNTFKIIGAILVLIGVILALIYRFFGFIVLGIGLILFYYQDFFEQSSE